MKGVEFSLKSFIMEFMTTPITKELKRKISKRKLHPQFRLMLEEKLFEDGIIPSCFINKEIQLSIKYSLLYDTFLV